MAAPTTAIVTTRPDGLDRFFNIAESFVCSTDNTTNVEMDPDLLRQQEAELQALCGGQAHVQPINAEENSILASATNPCVPQIATDLARKLGPNGSDISGNTTLETMSRRSYESMKQKSILGKRRRGLKFFRAFRCFKPRRSIDDVLSSMDSGEVEVQV